jgi:hypothetical protein
MRHDARNPLLEHCSRGRRISFLSARLCDVVVDAIRRQKRISGSIAMETLLRTKAIRNFPDLMKDIDVIGSALSLMYRNLPLEIAPVLLVCQLR